MVFIVVLVIVVVVVVVAVVVFGLGVGVGVGAFCFVLLEVEDVSWGGQQNKIQLESCVAVSGFTSRSQLIRRMGGDQTLWVRVKLS